MRKILFLLIGVLILSGVGYGVWYLLAQKSSGQFHQMLATADTMEITFTDATTTQVYKKTITSQSQVWLVAGTISDSSVPKNLKCNFVGTLQFFAKGNPLLSQPAAINLDPVCGQIAYSYNGKIFHRRLLTEGLDYLQGVQAELMNPTPVSTAPIFTTEVNTAIDKFITTRIDVLSPVKASSGTKFAVNLVEHTGPGETRVVYTDTSVTYTAKGVFQMVDSKKLNIISFDILSSTTPSSTVAVQDEGHRLAEEYIKAHLSELSPEKEVLGGKFFITKISFENAGTAVVEYEDGHNAYKARVSFMVDGGKGVEVLKWEMLPLK